MEPKDLTIEVLKDIRHELRETRTELRAELRDSHTSLKAEIAQTRSDLNTRIDDLTAHVVTSEIRVATAITDLHGTVRELTDVLRAQHDLRPRLDRCEHDIVEIKQRLHL